MWIPRRIAGVRSRWGAFVKSGCLLPVVAAATCVGVCHYDRTHEEQRREAEISRQRANDPCRYDDEFRRAHPELEALSERHAQEMIQWTVQNDLDDLELKADEIKDKLRGPEVVGQQAVLRAELAGKMAERRIAQLDALLKKHEVEWKIVCEAAIAKPQ